MQTQRSLITASLALAISGEANSGFSKKSETGLAFVAEEVAEASQMYDWNSRGSEMRRSSWDAHDESHREATSLACLTDRPFNDMLLFFDMEALPDGKAKSSATGVEFANKGLLAARKRPKFQPLR